MNFVEVPHGCSEDAEYQVVSAGLLCGIDTVQHNLAFDLECSRWVAENEVLAKNDLCPSSSKEGIHGNQ